MNGVNSHEEGDKKPFVLCVICVRKLQFNIKFSFIERYKKMIEFC